MKKNTFVGLRNRGQVGPMSLEDIFPMMIAVIILFVFIAFIFNVVGGNLSQRNAEALHSTSLGISHILLSRSVFVYQGKEGLFDSTSLDDYAFRYPELSSKYGVAGHNISIKVSDLEDPARKWVYEPATVEQNSVALSFPVAIRYSVDEVHSGLLEVRVWRTK